MSQIIRKRKGSHNFLGFTLVELLVAVAIVGIISVISVQSLYDSVSIRAKQYSIEDSSDDFRSIAKLIAKEVLEGKNVKIPNSGQIVITGNDSCSTTKTISFNSASKSVVESKTTYPPCASTTSGPTTLSGSNIEITNLSFSPVSESPGIITLSLDGVYKNSLGDHPFNYQTTITQRVSL